MHRVIIIIIIIDIGVGIGIGIIIIIVIIVHLGIAKFLFTEQEVGDELVGVAVRREHLGQLLDVRVPNDLVDTTVRTGMLDHVGDLPLTVPPMLPDDLHGGARADERVLVLDDDLLTPRHLAVPQPPLDLLHNELMVVQVGLLVDDVEISVTEVLLNAHGCHGHGHGGGTDWRNLVVTQRAVFGGTVTQTKREFDSYGDINWRATIDPQFY